MRITIDLTRELFDDASSINLYDGKTIFFDATTVLPSTVSFKVWGAGMMPGFDWAKYIDLDKAHHIKSLVQKSIANEIIVKGFGTLTFHDVVAGNISITPLHKKAFLKDNSGKLLNFKRAWTLENIDNDCYEYLLDTAIFFPYGACNLKLYAKGAASFDFDTNDCVSGVEYLSNPNREDTFYGFLKDKTLTTNSYNFDDFIT